MKKVQVILLLLLLTIPSRSQDDISGKYGIVDMDGRITVPFQYDVINYRRNTMTRLPEGMYAASKNGSWGIIDKNGKEIVPFMYNDMTDYTEEGFIVAKKEDKYGVIGIKGDVKIPFHYKEINFLSRRLLSVKDISGKSTIIDTIGNVIYSRPFFIARRQKNNRIWVLEKTEDDKERWGAIDREGILKVPFRNFDRMEDFTSEGYAKIEIDGGFGIIDSLGNIIVPAIYTYWKLDMDENFIIIGGDNETTIFKVAKKDSISLPYDDIRYLEYGLFLVEKGDKVGIINDRGDIVQDLKYKNAAGIFDGGLFVLQNSKGKYGTINSKGEITTPFKFDYLDNFYEGYAVAELGNKRGIIDEAGKTVIPFMYFSIDIKKVTNGNLFFSAAIQKEGERFEGLIDINNKLVLPYEYETIISVGNDRICVRKNNLYGLVDFTRKIIVPINYEQILFNNDRIILKHK